MVCSFKAIEEHSEEVRSMVEQYMGHVQSLSTTDTLLQALTPDPPPAPPTPSTSSSGSSLGNRAPSLAQVGSASDSHLTYYRGDGAGPLPSPSALFTRTFSYAMRGKGPAEPSASILIYHGRPCGALRLGGVLQCDTEASLHA